MSLFVDKYRRTGQVEEGPSLEKQALGLVEQTEERYYEAELVRLQGELLLQRSPHEQSDGQAWFAKVLDVARRPKLATCSPQSMASSPRVLIQQTSRMPRSRSTTYRGSGSELSRHLSIILAIFLFA